MSDEDVHLFKVTDYTDPNTWISDILNTCNNLKISKANLRTLFYNLPRNGKTYFIPEIWISGKTFDEIPIAYKNIMGKENTLYNICLNYTVLESDGGWIASFISEEDEQKIIDFLKQKEQTN